jgi:hypothetical protein
MRTYILIFISASLFAQGCGKSTPRSIPSDKYRVTVESLFESKWAIVKRLMITARGKRTIALGEGRTGLFPTPEDTGDVISAEVILMAVVSPGTEQLTWYNTVYQLRGAERQSGGGGTPRTFTIIEASRKRSDLVVSQLVELRIKSGDYPYGQDIQLGEIVAKIQHPPALVMRIE